MRFEQSLRGLSIGAPIDLRGAVVGKVVSIDLDFDPDRQTFPSIVGALIYPQRLGRVHEKVAELRKNESDEERLVHIVKPLVARGFRAQVRTGSLLTGQLYIELDFVQNAPAITFDENQRPIELPTANGSLDKLQEQLSSIVAKIDRIPFESIGAHLDGAIVQLDQTLQHVDGAVLPQLGSTLSSTQGAVGDVRKLLADDAPLRQSLMDTLAQMQRMARALRVVADELGRHPDMLLRGSPADAPPPNATKDR
jgi:paraquat-inducible protein B